MSIVQAVYGVTDAGWKLTAIDGKLSLKAEKLLKEVASVSAVAAEAYALDYADGVYMYSRTVQNGVDSVGRPAQLTHGYFFTKEELETVSGFERMLRIESFVSSCSEQLTPMKELPQKESGRKAEVHLTALLVVFCQAIAEKKCLNIVVSDEGNARKVLAALVGVLPPFLKRLATFSIGASGRERRIAFTTARGNSGLYYDAETGFSNGSETFVPFAEELVNDKEAEKTLNGFASASAKRLQSDYEIALEVFEKWMIGKENFAYFKEAPIALFARLTGNGRYADAPYRVLLRRVLEELAEWETDVRTYYGNIVENLIQCADGTDGETESEGVLFLLKVYTRYRVASLVRLFTELRKKPSMHQWAISILLKDEQFFDVLTEYVNLYFTVVEFRIGEALSAREYQALVARLAEMADAPQLEQAQVLNTLFDVDDKSAKRFEEALCRCGASAVVESVYLSRLEEWGNSRAKLFALFERLERLGIDPAAFAKASWTAFRGFCVAEAEMGLLAEDEANNLLKTYAESAGVEATAIALPSKEKKGRKKKEKKAKEKKTTEKPSTKKREKKSAREKKTGIWEKVFNSPAFVWTRFVLVTAAVLAATAPLAYLPLSAYLQGVIDASTAGVLVAFAFWDTLQKKSVGNLWIRLAIGLMLWLARVAVYAFTLY